MTDSDLDNKSSQELKSDDIGGAFPTLPGKPVIANVSTAAGGHHHRHHRQKISHSPPAPEVKPAMLQLHGTFFKEGTPEYAASMADAFIPIDSPEAKRILKARAEFVDGIPQFDAKKNAFIPPRRPNRASLRIETSSPAAPRVPPHVHIKGAQDHPGPGLVQTHGTFIREGAPGYAASMADAYVPVNALNATDTSHLSAMRSAKVGSTEIKRAINPENQKPRYLKPSL